MSDVKKRSNSSGFVIFFIVALVIFGAFMYYNNLDKGPTKVIKKFVNAVNEKDLNTLAECLDPKEEKMYKATSSILSSFIGINISDLVDMIPFLYNFNIIQGDHLDMKLDIIKFVDKDISGDRAEIRVLMSMETSDRYNKRETERGEAIFYLRKFNAGWRIIDMR